MNNLTFHWKNYRDNAGVETANRLILLFGYQAITYPDKNLKKIDFAQQFNIYKANFIKLLEYKIFERSSLWEDKYKDLLTQYYEDGNSEGIENTIKSLQKESFYSDFYNSIVMHKRNFKDEAEISISRGVFFLLLGISIFGIFALIEKLTNNATTWSELTSVGCCILIGFLMVGNGVKNLCSLKFIKPHKLVKYLDNEFCYEKLNDELDLVSSYFTDEAKKRQIIDLKLNYNFKKLNEASEEFGFLIIHGIEEEYFTFDGKHLGFTKYFPKYVFPTFVQCEDFFLDFKRSEENPWAFHVAMKKELDSLIGEDSSRCGGNNLTKAKSAWNPNGKDLHNKLLKVIKIHRKELEAIKK